LVILKNIKTVMLPMDVTRWILCTLSVFMLTGNPGQAVPDSTSISLGYPVYSQYLQNGLVINPAYTGTRGALSGFLSYRQQWMGTPGAPVLQSGSFHAPFKNDKVALGLLAQFMQYGISKTTSIYGSYAYHIRLKKGKISFGLKGGIDMSNNDFSKIDPAVKPDNVFTGTDEKYILPNIGAGAYYFSDKYFAGVSVPQFMSYKKNSTNNVQAYHSFSDYDFVLSGGALITFSDFFKFKPSVLVHYSLDEAEKFKQFDINGNFILADIVWLGGSWRTNEQVIVGILQLQISPQLMFGFSYDYPVGRMSSYSNGSAEFALRYEFGSKVSAANPRYF
jgi:type IX secretion system PorP/SprF family membrane protein